MSGVKVEIMQGGESFALGRWSNDVVLQERTALLTISGTAAPVYLNDKLLDLQKIAGEVRVASINLLNRPGMHRLTIRTLAGDFHYDFATATSKATWQEIEGMIAAVRLYALGPSRPFLYMGSGGEQELQSIQKLIFWLRDRLTEIELLSRSIDRAPAARSQPRLRTSARAHQMDLRATAGLLRERPSLMEEGNGGPIELGGASYWPALIRARSKEAAIPKHEHRQLRTLLELLLFACKTSAVLVPDVTPFLPRISALLGLRTLTFSVIGVGSVHPSLRESLIELRDPRYRRLRQIFLEYHDQFNHLNSSATIRAGLRDVWEIYQEFVAYMVGSAFDLTCSSAQRSLRTRDQAGASMAGHGISLFYDAEVPDEYLKSWRSSSTRPAHERPDIVLIDQASNRTIVLDVKFSVDDQGHCRSEHVFEMQGYMNSYGIAASGIVFPGDPSTSRVISNQGFKITEIPLRASTLNLSAGGLHDLRAQLEPMWTPYSPST